jgi:hypothetical protein
MTQFEQENDFGRGGGEVDEETKERAWEVAREREGDEHLDEQIADEDSPARD